MTIGEGTHTKFELHPNNTDAPSPVCFAAVFVDSSLLRRDQLLYAECITAVVYVLRGYGLFLFVAPW